MNKINKLLLLLNLSLMLILCYWIFYFMSFEGLRQATSKFMTPGNLTDTAISETMYRIHFFAKNKGEIPEDLSLLPIRENHSNKTCDWWGRPLIYFIDKDKHTLTLTSLGRDGLRGGEGDNKDIYASYYYIKPDGTFWANQGDWPQKAVIEKSWRRTNNGEPE